MLQKLLTVLLSVALSVALFADSALAQQEVKVRELHTYDFELESQADLPEHPMVGEEVTFQAVVVSNPKSSGLASITDAGVPGRIHVFVTDVSAIEDGEDGMSIQIVVSGAERTTLEGLNRGDVIDVIGELTFFNNVSQFNATEVTFIGSVDEAQFEDLAPLLEPTVIDASELNIEGDEPGTFMWNAENYTKYINRYVKIEGAEVIDRLEADNGRPWVIASTGNSILTSNDTSLRFRNDRNNYAYDPEEDEGLGYNYRRTGDGGVDGPYVPPPNGAVVNWSGFVVVNTFDPGGFDVSTAQSTFKIAYFEDGYVWTADGNDPADRLQPEDWPNDLEVLGFAPTISNLAITPDPIRQDDEISITVDVQLPEVDYSLESVTISYMAYAYDDDEPTMITEDMVAGSGSSYSFSIGGYDTFTIIDFTIDAVAETPDGIETRAQLSESISVVSDTQTSPVTFSPAAGEYQNFVTVSMESVTEGAEIYYTLDGSTPTSESTLYTEPLTIDITTTITAIAISDGLEDSPVNSRLYEIDRVVVEVSTLADLRNGTRDGTLYEFQGDAVVVYTRNARNQKYLMDETGGILIDDPNGVITSAYVIGSVMSDVSGTLSAFQGVVQFTPAANPGDAIDNVTVEPKAISLADLNLDQHESTLVQVEAASFIESGTFDGGENYSLVDASLEDEETVVFRTNFGEADYIGEAIPEGEFTLTAIVGNFNGTIQLIARNSADLGQVVSIVEEKDGMPVKFALEQNYPNPFNPTTTINYSLAQATDVTLTVYDILGRRISVLVNENLQPGSYTATFDATHLASGTYLYRLETADFVSVRKMLLIK